MTFTINLIEYAMTATNFWTDTTRSDGLIYYGSIENNDIITVSAFAYNDASTIANPSNVGSELVILNE